MVLHLRTEFEPHLIPFHLRTNHIFTDADWLGLGIKIKYIGKS